MGEFIWTPEQRTQLTVGCSVMSQHFGRRVVFGGMDDSYKGDPDEPFARLRFAGWSDTGDLIPVSDLDPTTLRAPAIPTLRAMAQAKLGPKATVTASPCPDAPGFDISVYERANDFPLYRATFSGRKRGAARDCAIWLHALPGRVS